LTSFLANFAANVSEWCRSFLSDWILTYLHASTECDFPRRLIRLANTQFGPGAILSSSLAIRQPIYPTAAVLSLFSRRASQQPPCFHYPAAVLSNSRAFTIQQPRYPAAAVLSLSSNRAFQQPSYHYPAVVLSDSRRAFTIQQPRYPTAELSPSSNRAFTTKPPSFPTAELSLSSRRAVQQPNYYYPAAVLPPSSKRAIQQPPSFTIILSSSQ
jgi:hypothetical protein